MLEKGRYCVPGAMVARSIDWGCWEMAGLVAPGSVLWIDRQASDRETFGRSKQKQVS